MVPKLTREGKDKMKAKKAEHTTHGSKAHKSIMPTHWAAESTGLNKSTIKPKEKMKKHKMPSMKHSKEALKEAAIHMKKHGG
jgi:hypothetical protein